MNKNPESINDCAAVDVMGFPHAVEWTRQAQELSDYIRSLPLSAEQNDKLIAMMIEHTENTEMDAFHHGVCMAARFRRARREREY